MNGTPISKIVCWKCGKGGGKGESPLKKISPTNYVCLNDLHWGAPSEENRSEIFFTKEEKEEVVHGHK